MNTHKSIALPAAEYERLQRLMLTMIGSRSVLASVLRRKLGSARPTRSFAADRKFATSGIVVSFRVDREHHEHRILSWEPPRQRDTVHLSLLSPRGLALLGLGPGEAIAYRTASGRTEYLEVDRVSAAESPKRSTNATTSSPRDILKVASVTFIAPEVAI